MGPFLMRILALGLVAGAALAQGVQAWLERGERLLSEGAYAEAVAAFEEVLRQDYGQFQAHLGLGVALVRLGRLEEARFAFDQMTRVFPDRYEGHFNLGQVYLRLGEAGKAAEAFAKAAAIAPREEAYLAWSGALLQEGKAREAAAVLERGLSPERSPAYRLALAQALYAAGEREAAVPHLYAALNREPGRAEAWDLLARVLAEVGLTDRARREVERGLEAVQDPKGKALLLLRKGTLVEGPEPLWREALALDPDLWQAAYLLGRRRLEVGDLKEGLRWLQEAYAKGQDPEVALALAAAYLKAKDYANAYRYAKEAGPAGAFLQAQAAQGLGRRQEALKLLEGLASPQALALRGSLLLEEGQGEEAVAALQAAYEATRDPQVGVNLGAALVLVKRFGQAELVLREVLAKDASSAAAWYNLGLALRGLGRQAEADRALRQAAALGSREARALFGR